MLQGSGDLIPKPYNPNYHIGYKESLKFALRVERNFMEVKLRIYFL